MKLLINLLPSEERGCPRYLKKILFLSVCLWLFSLLIGYFYLTGRVAFWEKRVLEAEREGQLLKTAEAALFETNEKKAAINARNEILFELCAARSSWMALLVHLGECVPENVNLSEVEKSEKETILLRGRAQTTSAVLQFLKDLNQDKFFNGAKLISIGQDNPASPGFTDFELAVACKEL